MFIHLGGDVIIRSKDIIAILNRDIKEVSPTTKHFLKAEEKRKKKTVISTEDSKSIVLTNDEIFYSPISALTLNRRALGKSILEQSVELEGEVEL
ncbi:DUF370 domain-containing protein [bacterium LRH843]|nr:DUF370 domain-containing protein [bacterium LRH843]